MSITSFEDLCKQSTDFDQLTKQLKGGKKDYNDVRFWKPTKDNAGNANAVIRFLPVAKGNDLPFVEKFEHFFQGPTGLYFNQKCPTTIGRTCPVCESNRELWNTKLTSNETIARDRKRKQKFVANILVLKDAANPENENKVFLYEFGVQIMSKITDVTAPEFEGDEKINAFHFIEGANFKLRVNKKDKYDTYEKSTFDAKSKLYNGDMEKLKVVWEAEHSLKEFTDPEQYLSYEDLEKKFHSVVNAKEKGTAKTFEEEIESSSASPFSTGVTTETFSSSPSVGDTLDLDDLESLGDDMDAFKAMLE